MVVKIKTKNFASNVGVEDLAKKELARVEKMFVKDTIYDVCVKKEKNKANKTVYKCDITIKNGKQFVRGFAEGDSVEASIDMAVDSLKRKARKAKTLSMKKRKEYGKFIAPEYEEVEESADTLEFEIGRVKEIEVGMMSAEEAAMQMELSGHDFFVFKDEDGIVNVVYKRAQGYGVIVAR